MVKEFWSRVSDTVGSDFETSSSENSIEEYVEYRDASCNVDFDDDSDEASDEDVPNVRTKLSKSIDEFPQSIEKNVDIEASRYVHWNILMSLGIGLWSILCIVDLLQSEKSMTRDWFYELFWKKKDVLEIVEGKQLESQILWYSNLWPYLRSIATIATSVGAYILLFVLLIVFCTDPRLRKTFVPSSIQKNVSKHLPTTKKLNKSLVVKKSSRIKKNLVSPLLLVSNIPKTVSMELKPPPRNLQRKIQSCIQQPVKTDITKMNVLPNRSSCLSSTKLQKPATRFSINRVLSDLFDGNIHGTLIVSRIDQFEWHAITKSSVSLRFINSSGGDLNLSVSSHDLEIGEYLKKRRRRSQAILDDPCGTTKRNLLNSPEVALNQNFRTRIITSSPAFKKFLSTYQHNTRIS